MTRFLTEEDYIKTKSLKKKFVGCWAVFRVSNGKKFFLSSLYKKDLRWNEAKLKYSNENTLKFNQEFATKIALINKCRLDTCIGIVNDKGVQIIL